jgi:Ca2+ transporting ATPase
VDYASIREANPTGSFSKVFTFNSARKSMSTIIPLPSGGYLLLCKGASEIVLSKCSSVVGENGRILPLSAGEIINTVVQPMANNALRTLCMAYKLVREKGIFLGYCKNFFCKYFLQNIFRNSHFSHCFIYSV